MIEGFTSSSIALNATPTTTQLMTTSTVPTTNLTSIDLFEGVTLGDDYKDMLKRIFNFDYSTTTKQVSQNILETLPIIKYPFTKNNNLFRLYTNFIGYYNDHNNLASAITFIGGNQFNNIITNELKTNTIDFINNINNYLNILESLQEIIPIQNKKIYTKYQISYIVNFIFNFNNRGNKRLLSPKSTLIIYNPQKTLDDILNSEFITFKGSNDINIINTLYNVLFKYIETHKIKQSFRPFNVIYKYINENDIDELLDIIKENYFVDDEFNNKLNTNLIKATISFNQIPQDNNNITLNNSNDDIIFDLNNIVSELNKKNLIQNVEYDNETNKYTITIKNVSTASVMSQFNNIEYFNTTSSNIVIPSISPESELVIVSSDNTQVNDIVIDNAFIIEPTSTETATPISTTTQLTTTSIDPTIQQSITNFKGAFDNFKTIYDYVYNNINNAQGISILDSLDIDKIDITNLNLNGQSDEIKIIDDWTISNTSELLDKLINFSVLQSLDLSNTSINGHISELFKNDADISALLSLNLSNTSINGDIYGLFKNITDISELRYLYLSNNKSINGDIYGLFKEVTDISALQFLDLSYTSINGDICGLFKDGAKISALQNLNLSNTSINGNINGLFK
jgi:hypothetical protein